MQKTAWFMLAALTLTACSGNPEVRELPRWQAPELQSRLEALRCRVAPDCTDFPILLVDRDEPQAELLYDGRLAIRRGLVEATQDEAELAFVIAHEIAHRHRQHHPVADLSLRLPLELEADADARAQLCSTGMPGDAGRELLRRLWPLDSETEAQHPAAARQIEARINALTPCSSARAVSVHRSDPQAWRALLDRAGAQGATPAN